MLATRLLGAGRGADLVRVSVSLLYPSYGSGCVVACMCVPFDGERSRSDLARLVAARYNTLLVLDLFAQYKELGVQSQSGSLSFLTTCGRVYGHFGTTSTIAVLSSAHRSDYPDAIARSRLAWCLSRSGGSSAPLALSANDIHRAEDSSMSSSCVSAGRKDGPCFPL
uniref:(California timema) hypothetical protein n=1 Tax=Timema californicum TaxID=61474 RepID=A0A7R9IZK4_TIMCA|nr:unnamed protein product [Timema californicum]